MKNTQKKESKRQWLISKDGENFNFQRLGATRNGIFQSPLNFQCPLDTVTFYLKCAEMGFEPVGYIENERSVPNSFCELERIQISVPGSFDLYQFAMKKGYLKRGRLTQLINSTPLRCNSLIEL